MPKAKPNAPTIFQGSGYNSQGQRTEGQDESCRVCREPLKAHDRNDNRCPCEMCGVPHRAGCPQEI